MAPDSAVMRYQPTKESGLAPSVPCPWAMRRMVLQFTASADSSTSPLSTFAFGVRAVFPPHTLFSNL